MKSNSILGKPLMAGVSIILFRITQWCHVLVLIFVSSQNCSWKFQLWINFVCQTNLILNLITNSCDCVCTALVIAHSSVTFIGRQFSTNTITTELLCVFFNFISSDFHWSIFTTYFGKNAIELDYGLIYRTKSKTKSWPTFQYRSILIIIVSDERRATSDSSLNYFSVTVLHRKKIPAAWRQSVWLPAVLSGWYLSKTYSCMFLPKNDWHFMQNTIFIKSVWSFSIRNSAALEWISSYAKMILRRKSNVSIKSKTCVESNFSAIHNWYYNILCHSFPFDSVKIFSLYLLWTAPGETF